MHIVYIIYYTERIKNNTYPFYYIGSKTNCTFKDGVIYDKRGKQYWGSSQNKKVKDELLKVAYVLSTEETGKNALERERELQLFHNVVASPMYANLSIATESNFTDPMFATYKHAQYDKVVRLRRDSPEVLNGTYVGVTKCHIQTEESKKKRGRSGENNHFYGKKHDAKTKEKIIKTRDATYQAEPERREKWLSDMSTRISTLMKGVPKSDEHRSKIGRKNMTMLKNVVSGECIRVLREDVVLYDADIWKHPNSITPQKLYECAHCKKLVNGGNFKRWHDDNCKMRSLNFMGV